MQVFPLTVDPSVQQGKVHKALKHMVNDKIINNNNDIEVTAIKNKTVTE